MRLIKMLIVFPLVFQLVSLVVMGPPLVFTALSIRYKPELIPAIPDGRFPMLEEVIKSRPVGPEFAHVPDYHNRFATIFLAVIALFFLSLFISFTLTKKLLANNNQKMRLKYGINNPPW